MKVTQDQLKALEGYARLHGGPESFEGPAVLCTHCAEAMGDGWQDPRPEPYVWLMMWPDGDVVCADCYGSFEEEHRLWEEDQTQ